MRSARLKCPCVKRKWFVRGFREWDEKVRGEFTEQLNLIRLLARKGAVRPSAPAMVRAGREMVPRGRVELPTPAFSGPRSTGELPRHREQTFYAKRREGQSETRRILTK